MSHSNSNLLVFQPIYNLSVWKDPESKNQKFSIRILLPTGVGENPGDLNVCVEDGNLLKITVMWPTAMI